MGVLSDPIITLSLLLSAFLFISIVCIWKVVTLRARVTALQTENTVLEQSVSTAEFNFSALQDTHELQLESLRQNAANSQMMFENLANKIFDQKAAVYQQESRRSLEQSTQPLKQQLESFKARIEQVYDTESRDRSKLLFEIAELKRSSTKISDDAVKLTNALKGDNKQQGNWGELILEQILEASGLRDGHEYFTQTSFKDSSGARKQPDVIVRLPGNKDVVIDSKVSLTDFEKYINAELAEDKQAHLKGFTRSVSQHIKGLSGKDYQALDDLRSLDFVLLFMPIESAFSLLVDEQPEIIQTALNVNVILVTPTTLMATLRTIDNVWRIDRQNQNAKLIADQAGGIYDQVALIVESLEQLQGAVDKVNEAQDRLLKRVSTGKGNLLRRTQQLKELGAKTKRQLPAELHDEVS